VVVVDNQNRYLALSGGGFNAHSSHAGWLAGAMDGLAALGKDNDVDNILGKVRGLSSSSGGTWFSSQLGYSDAFRSQFESKAGRDAYNVSGYNGQLKQIFRALGYNSDGTINLSSLPASTQVAIQTLGAAIDAVRPGSPVGGKSAGEKNFLDQLLFLPAMADNTVTKSGLNWRGFVDNYVNKPLGIDEDLKNLSLSSDRGSWAKDVDFVMGGVMQTSPVALGQYGNGNIKTLAKVSAVPSDSAVPSQKHFTPLSMVSRAPEEVGANPTASALFTAGDFNRTYQGEFLGRRTAKNYKQPIKSSLANALSLVEVSTISSAAAGLLAGTDSLVGGLPSLLQDLSRPIRNEVENLLRDFAPAVTIKNGILGPVPALSASQKNTRGAAGLGAVRLADSGYVDNSSVGYLLRDIQDTKGVSSPFEIALFMNSSEAPDPVTGLNKRVRVGPSAGSLSSFGLASEVPNLFGQSIGDGTLDGDVIVNALSAPRLPIYTPSAKVFEEAAWYGKSAPDWSYSKGSVNLSYHNLDVKTVDNKTFGVKGGQAGKLHIFSAINRDSFAAPLYFGQLDEYAENYDVIREGIANQGGFAYLQAALGMAVLPA
jgi:hypothetical protein